MIDHNVLLILVTVPDKTTAETIAERLVTEKLAACVNIIPGITSIYRWKGEIEKDGELLLLIKSISSKSEDVADAVNELHPYDLPEFIEIQPDGGSVQYLSWIRNEVT